MIFVPKCENFTMKRDLLGWQLRRSKEIVELKANCDVLSSASKVIKGLVCARVVSIRTVQTVHGITCFALLSAGNLVTKQPWDFVRGSKILN